ncbi:MAG: FAD:protein FMN transferase [Defluviitaleaceae bacterium]|nr:FAD:protein FMN transferase [Defluviitaleaceae bacterium]
MPEIFYEIQDFLMNTNVEQKIVGDNSSDIYNTAMKELHRLESMMSFYKEASEVSLLNRQSGKEVVKLSSEMMLVLQQSEYFSILSENAFNIMLSPLIQLWRSAGKRNELPSDNDIENALYLCNSDNLVICEETAYLKKEGCMIDLGGIGKGFAADVCCNIYKDMGAKSAFINLGGNVKAIGNRADGKQWTVGIQHPDKPRGNCYCAIMCSDLSVVTSGGYERYQEINGVKYHHILDGRTGYPSDTDLKSVTVISKSSTQADALSTAAFVMGLKRGIDLIYASKCVGAIFFTTSNEIYMTKGVNQNLKLLERMKCYEV